jgi:hypothetical protein
VTLGLLDLSIVTDQVLAHLDTAATASQLWAEEPTAPAGTPAGTTQHPIDPTKKFTIHFTGLPPKEARALGGCQVSFYLFHVAPNAAHLNTSPYLFHPAPPPPGTAPNTTPQTNFRHPLALTLYYLLSAHSVNSYIEEQQAMSIALKCLHEHAITTATVPKGSRLQEFTVTMEPQSVDEMGRLWLSLATPLGLSAVYRASVIFLEPAEEPGRPAKHPDVAEVDAVPVDHPQIVRVVNPGTAIGIAAVRGTGFDPATIELTIGALSFAVVTGGGLGPGQARVVSATELQLRMPAKTPRGRYALQIRLTPDSPAQEVLLHLTEDVP